MKFDDEDLVHPADRLERVQVVLGRLGGDVADSLASSALIGWIRSPCGLEDGGDRVLGEPVDLEVGVELAQLVGDRDVPLGVTETDRRGDVQRPLAAERPGPRHCHGRIDSMKSRIARLTLTGSIDRNFLSFGGRVIRGQTIVSSFQNQIQDYLARQCSVAMWQRFFSFYCSWAEGLAPLFRSLLSPSREALAGLGQFFREFAFLNARARPRDRGFQFKTFSPPMEVVLSASPLSGSVVFCDY